MQKHARFHRSLARSLWLTLVGVIFGFVAVATSHGDTVDVRSAGAIGDGVTKDTFAFQNALDACRTGGGTVTVPAGKYRIGSIDIPSNTTLSLADGAELVGSPDLADYPIVRGRWEGRWTDVHRALLSASDAKSLAIIGKGSIAANPNLGGRSQPRQPCVIEFIRCTDVRLEGFSARQQRMWTIHPTLCDRLRIKGLTIRSTGGNGDGIDLDSCTDAIIEDCDIDTGDDCISLKSGRGREGFLEAKPTENVIIRNCTLADSIFACIGIGSETSGGIRNVTIEHITCTRAKTYAIYIKSRTDRGAFIENIIARDIVVQNADGGFLRFNLTRSGIADPEPVTGIEGVPAAKDFSFSDIRLTGAVGTLVDGVNVPAEKPMEGLRLRTLRGKARKGMSLANVVDAQLEDIDVAIEQGSKLATRNVTGTGLDGAIDLPTTAPTTR